MCYGTCKYEHYWTGECTGRIPDDAPCRGPWERNCDKCGEFFESDDYLGGLCDDCKKKQEEQTACDQELGRGE